MRGFVIAIAAVAGFYVLLCLLALLMQRWAMYPAPAIAVEPQAAGAKLFQIPAIKGGVVYAWYFPAPAGSPTVVHFHGNGEQLADQEHFGVELKKRGIGFFAVEYPGYGMAKNDTTTEAACYDAAEAALSFLRDKLDAPPERTILQGQSLGSGVAVEMALRGRGAGLVLISPFTSMVDMARNVAPFLPMGLLVKDRYDSAAKASTVHLPVLVIHGVRDEIVPYWMGEQLSKNSPGRSC